MLAAMYLPLNSGSVLLTVLALFRVHNAVEQFPTRKAASDPSAHAWSPAWPVFLLLHHHEVLGRRGHEFFELNDMRVGDCLHD